jgi:hypothetical protein
VPLQARLSGPTHCRREPALFAVSEGGLGSVRVPLDRSHRASAAKLQASPLDGPSGAVAVTEVEVVAREAVAVEIAQVPEPTGQPVHDEFGNYVHNGGLSRPYTPTGTGASHVATFGQWALSTARERMRSSDCLGSRVLHAMLRR